MAKTLIPIVGMHCKSCEILIEDELKQIPGVSKTNIDHKSAQAEIIHEENVAFNLFETAIKNAGYKIGKEEKLSLLTNNKALFREIGIYFLLVLIVFFTIQNFGFFNINLNSEGNYASLPLVFLIGLTAGLSTCMALVGGLVLGISSGFAKQNPQSNSLQKFMPHLYFNLGRIGGFFLLGGIIGSAGGIFQISPLFMGFMTIAVGLVMLLLGLKLTEISPRLNTFSFTIPKAVSRTLGIKSSKETIYSPTNSIIAGAATFFLPCGFTQAMQLYAISTGNPASGALTMGVFALGTTPGLLGIGGLTSMVKGIFAKRFFRFVGIIVIFMAFFNLINGFNLTGISPLFASSKSVNNNVSFPPLENGYQIIRMTQESNGYLPNNFTVKKGVPVKWIITSQDPYSCASSIVAGSIGVRKNLVKGENIIEFTPEEEGAIRFSCSMGMYTGTITAVGDNGQIEDTTNKPQNSQPVPDEGSGCGCGS